MGVMDRIRRLGREQQEALRAIDREEQNAIELENLEADHIAAEEAYLRRKDRLLGHDVPDVYVEIESARSEVAAKTRIASRAAHTGPHIRSRSVYTSVVLAIPLQVARHSSARGSGRRGAPELPPGRRFSRPPPIRRAFPRAARWRSAVKL